MVSSVNSSSKAVYGFAAVAALAVVTILFFRARSNTAAHPAASSLDQKNVSFMARIPVISLIWSLFFRAEAMGEGAVSVVCIGSDKARYKSIEALEYELKRIEARPGSINTLIIYGDNLELVQDPGILELKPTKLILVGITLSTDTTKDCLARQMYTKRWYVDKADTTPYSTTVIKVPSLQKAVEADLQINPNLGRPFPTVFIVTG